MINPFTSTDLKPPLPIHQRYDSNFDTHTICPEQIHNHERVEASTYLHVFYFLPKAMEVYERNCQPDIDMCIGPNHTLPLHTHMSSRIVQHSLCVMS